MTFEELKNLNTPITCKKHIKLHCKILPNVLKIMNTNVPETPHKKTEKEWTFPNSLQEVRITLIAKWDKDSTETLIALMNTDECNTAQNKNE